MTQEQKPPKQRGRHIPPGWQDPLRQQQPLVSHQWLLRTLGISLGVALLCAYLTLCLLFYQGRWQLLFHPSRAVTATPANVGMGFEDIHFDSTETGRAQLTGWWIPADPAARFSSCTLLYLHGARGSLSDTLPKLKLLHALGINIFVFDYRGFGNSMSLHPSEGSVYEDGDAAVAYLTDIRKLAAKSLVLYGEGLGATVAAEVAVRHPQVAALILENPTPPALEQITADRRTGLLPVTLLFADRFELAPKLKNMPTPKLFLHTRMGPPGETIQPYVRALYSSAAEPKRLSPDQGTLYSDEVLKFLDDSLPVEAKGAIPPTKVDPPAVAP